jgi:dihydroneopterin aldolase
METDELSGTVNYASVLEIIKGEMAMPSKLLEHVGGRIVKTIFSTFSDVSRVKLQIVKENPPFGADCKGAGIEIEEFRH